MDLCRFGCFILAILCYFMTCFLFELILLWSCIYRGLTLNLSQARICEILLSVQAFILKWYCLPSVVGLSYAHYFSKVFPETEGMCRADVWCNAILLRRWTSECFFYYFLSKNPLQYLNKDIQPILGGDGRNPPQQNSTKHGQTVTRGVKIISTLVNTVTRES